MSDRGSLEIKHRINFSDPDNLGYLELNHPTAVFQTKLVFWSFLIPYNEEEWRNILM